MISLFDACIKPKIRFYEPGGGKEPVLVGLKTICRRVKDSMGFLRKE